jgi:hypothetical protein
MNDSLSDSSSLFPLPLTAFEQFMVADDTPAYPMTFFIEIGVTGSLNKAAFESACQTARDRHPLLAANIRSRWGRWRWVPTSDSAIVSWHKSPTGMPSNADRHIDLRDECGLRISTEYHPDFSRIVFQFHHASTDGIGAIQFIGDVLAAYGCATAASDAEQPQFANLDAASLRLRGERWEKGKEPPRVLRRWFFRLIEVLGAIPCSIRRRTRLIDDMSRNELLFLTRFLERNEVKALNAEAARRNVTANELLTLAMFQTLHEWNRHHDRNGARDVFRIVMPASVRTPEHQDCPAANVLSYILLTRRGRDIVDGKSLMNYVASESRQGLNGRETGLVLLSMEAACVIPGLLRLLLRLPVRFATSILANVGDVKRQLRNQFPLHRGKCVAGNVTLDYLVGAAPVRKGTHVATSVGKYAGRFIINLNCDPDFFSRDEANEFAESYFNHLRALFAGSAPNLPAQHKAEGTSVGQV